MHTTRTRLIALTGGIGSGKSTALHMFAARGAAVLDLDRVVHELLDRPEIAREVSACLGLGDLAHGQEGRQQIADLVFADQEKLFDLEEILFPLVRREVERWRDSLAAAARSVAAGDGCLLAVVEAPMVFEAQMDDLFDAIVLVTAPEDIRSNRHARIVGRSDFERRTQRQLPEEEKEKRADYVYHNTGSPEGLDEFVEKTVALLKASRC